MQSRINFEENEMSLDWDSSSCAEYQRVKALKDAAEGDETTCPEWHEFVSLRESAVWTSLFTGFPKGTWSITEENWHEMFRRFNLYERVRGATRGQRGVPLYFTPAEVRKLIGLRTNAGNKTDAKFHSDLIALHRRNTDRMFYRQDVLEQSQQE